MWVSSMVMELPLKSHWNHAKSVVPVIQKSLCQQEFIKAYNINKCKKLDEKWVVFLYVLNMALNVVRHPAFIAAVKATLTAGFDYTPPTYHVMQTKHMEPKVKQVKAEIKKATKQSIALYGATICLDGWDNVIGR
jgi:hypothetical protein